MPAGRARSSTANIFTVYALKVDKLDVPADATAALIGYMLNANKLGTATFTAKYGRR